MAVSEKSISDKIETTSILEEIEKERGNNGIAIPEKYSHKEDLENLLKLAEDLKEKCDRKETRIKIQRIAQVFGAISVLVYTYYFSYRYPDWFTFKDILFVFVILIISVVCHQIFITNDIKKQYLGDKLALAEVLQLLRETSNIIANQEDWSVLSRAEFRIRLSRFNLEEKSKSALNFF